jgi:hypothetical protein
MWNLASVPQDRHQKNTVRLSGPKDSVALGPGVPEGDARGYLYAFVLLRFRVRGLESELLEEEGVL